MFYAFKLSLKTVELTKNIRWAKSEGAVDHSTVTNSRNFDRLDKA